MQAQVGCSSGRRRPLLGRSSRLDNSKHARWLASAMLIAPSGRGLTLRSTPDPLRPAALPARRRGLSCAARASRPPSAVGVSSNVRPRTNPSAAIETSAMQSKRLGEVANTSVRSAALTSFGVRGKGRRRAEVHDLARQAYRARHGAVANLGQRQRQRELPCPKLETVPSVLSGRLAAIAGAAPCATPSTGSAAAAAAYGSRPWRRRASATSIAKSCQSLRRERGAGVLAAKVATGQTVIFRCLAQHARPNPSLNPRPTTAGTVRPVGGRRSITARPYGTCLRGRG